MQAQEIEIDWSFKRVYKPVLTTDARYIDIWGGRGRGGSYFATKYFLFLLMQPEYFRGYFVREILGDIRTSLFQDIKDRIDEAGIDEREFNINETVMSITHLSSGNSILSKGFKKSSGKTTAKMKSLAGATHVLIEECEEVSKADFMQLDDSLRTIKGKLQILRVFNPPPKNHWLIKTNYNLTASEVPGYYTATVKADKNILSIHSTYLDNLKYMNESTISNFESYKESDDTLDYYYVVIKGLVSEGKIGRIYKTWKHIKDLPTDVPYYWYGLDFGFSNDPCALVKICSHNKTISAKEFIYETGLTNPQLSEKMIELGVSKREVIWADSAEMKSIQELKNLGWNIKPFSKTSDSIRQGIKFVQSFQVYLTEDSTNGWLENEEYCWALDQYKNPTDKPIDKHNHLKDAIRYGICGELEQGNMRPTKITRR